MTNLQKINSAVFGLIMVATAVIMAIYPKDAYEFVVFFMAIGFMISSVGALIYYFTMARYMVGGKGILYRAVIFMDFAFFTGSLSDVPRMYVLIYLSIIHLFSGLVEVLRSRESITNGSRQWKLKLGHGLFNIVMGLICIIFARKPNTAVYIYCAGIFYSGIIRIITAFRKSTMVYIQ